MEIGNMLSFFTTMFRNLFSFLDNNVVFTIGGISASYLQVIGACIIVGFVISLFWKGARQ